MEFFKEDTARKRNKYSIRKFSVGIASILVGSAFVYSNNEAQAAEAEVKNNVQQNGAAQSKAAQPKAQGATNTEQVTTNQEQAVQSLNTGSNQDVNKNSAGGNSTTQPKKQATNKNGQPNVVKAPVQSSGNAQTNSAVGSNTQKSQNSVTQNNSADDKEINKLKEQVNNKINKPSGNSSSNNLDNKDYYAKLVTKATSNLEDAAEKHRAKLTLETIDKRVDTALKEVKPVNIEQKTVDKHTKYKDVFNYINKQKQHLSQPELELFLRNASRVTDFPDIWKNYNALSDQATLGRLQNSEENITYLNKLLTNLQDLVQNRNNTTYYKELAKDNVVKELNNHFKLLNIIEKDGYQVANIEISRDSVDINEYENGKYKLWLNRFEQRGLRTNEAINNKIAKVTVTYRWNGQDYEEVLARDEKGFYWFREDEKFSGGKKSVGGSINFHVTFKKDTVLNKDTDKIWGYNISDGNNVETIFGANIGFSKINFDSQANDINTKTLTQLKTKALSHIDALTKVFDDSNEVKDFKEQINSINTSPKNTTELEDAIDKLTNVTHKLVKGALKHNLVAVPSQAQHIGQYAQQLEDGYYLAFQALNTDPVNSLNADSSLTINPKGYFFYTLKAENELAAGKKVNVKIVTSQVDPRAKFELGAQNASNGYIGNLATVSKVKENVYELRDYVIPQGAKKIVLRLDNRNGVNAVQVSGFKVISSDHSNPNSQNLLVIPGKKENIKDYATANSDPYFLSFQTLKTEPLNSLNADGSLTLKPGGYFFYNLKAQDKLAPGKQFSIKVLSNTNDANTKFEYAFHSSNGEYGKTIKVIAKTQEGVYSVEDVVVPDNATDVSLRLDNRLGKENAEIQGILVLPKKQ
ncbi:YSIRK-type signal peptide-containing protein [Staphylococcus kloosii]|uniref:YSIRK Gram-positive signal peptide domain-containing protein n=1 Tax=Staphylococcus kloosii TaxID=29384 RepID=A0A151A4B0_9STAP|nr:YSIRK-type signal peptide-containing protein [Staphylococcus kloosii]KYH14157.1 hypothetical protein A0131_05110 [Staphylococcus kloosii]